MKKSYQTHLYINYIIINVILVGLSFLGFIFGEKLLPLCVFICSLFGFLCLVLLVKSGSSMTPELGKGTFTLFLIFRYIFMALGLVAAALIIKFSMGEVENKYRYLLVAVSAIPYFTTSLTLLLTKQGDNNA